MKKAGDKRLPAFFNAIHRSLHFSGKPRLGDDPAKERLPGI